MGEQPAMGASSPGQSELLKWAANIIPLLERNANATDQLRRLPDENVQALKDSGLCRLMLPKKFGGYATNIHRGTGSNTIVAKNVFVPEHRFLPYPPAFQGHYRNDHQNEAVYRSAFVPVTILILIGSQLGLAQAALDYVIAQASIRGVTHTNYRKQTESTGFQILLAEAAMKIESAYLHAFRAADDIDRGAESNQYPDLTARARIRADAALTAKYCRESVDLLVSAHGTSSLLDTNRLQRIWRDIHVASHHAITEWQVNLEIYGKALLGIEPNITPLI